MVFVVLEDAFFLQLGQFGGHGGPFYAEIIRQLLPVVGDGKG